MKTLKNIRIHLLIGGTMWWPQVPGTLEVERVFAPGDGGPFGHPWTGLRDALEGMASNVGDFQDPSIVDAWGQVTWSEGYNTVIRGMEINRQAKAIADLFVPESEMHQYAFALEW